MRGSQPASRLRRLHRRPELHELERQQRRSPAFRSCNHQQTQTVRVVSQGLPRSTQEGPDLDPPDSRDQFCQNSGCELSFSRGAATQCVKKREKLIKHAILSCGERCGWIKWMKSHTASIALGTGYSLFANREYKRIRAARQRHQARLRRVHAWLEQPFHRLPNWERLYVFARTRRLIRFNFCAASPRLPATRRTKFLAPCGIAVKE